MPADSHRLAEERSIELHRAIVDRLTRDPSLVERARQRVQAWKADGSTHPTYADAWASLLDLPLEALCAFLVDEGEQARALRQVTPFAGVVDPRTRWRIWREVRERRSARQ